MKFNRITKRMAFLSAVLFISFHAFGVQIDPGIKNLDDLSKAVETTQELIWKSPEDCEILNKMARLLFTNGEYGEAEKYLHRTLEIKPGHVNSFTTLTELYWREYKFEEAAKYLDKAAVLAPGNASVLLLQAELAEKKMDFKTAEAIYRRILKKAPSSINALFGMAKTFFNLNRFDEAETYIQKCYDVAPDFGNAYLLHSAIHRMRQNNDGWKETARKAAALSPFNPEALVAYARVLMRGEGKLNEGAEQAKIALKIDPFSIHAHYYFGNGYTDVPYTDYKPERDEKTVREINELYRQGDLGLAAGDYEKADRAFTSLLKLDPKHIRGLIGKGAVHFFREEYDNALDCYFNALKVNPDYGLAHYGISLVLQRRLDQINIRFPQLEKQFAVTAVPEPPYLKEVFINYSRCSPDLQKIIRLTVSSLSNFMKSLKIAGATVYFMDTHRFLWECPNMAGIKGQRTFDLRLWDDVKGAGGYNCISNKSQQTDVKYLRFNVGGHEFAHLVQQLLTPTQRKELRRLFLKAREERKTLDWYADMNEWEYFAVGYEAFISKEKLPGQLDVYAHTRDQLEKKDPDLYHFIDQLNKAPDYRENEIMGYILKAEHSSRDDSVKRTDILKEGLSVYGNHPALLNTLAREYKRAKQYDQALMTYRQAIHAFPNDTEAYFETAEDLFLRQKNTGKAVAFLKSYDNRLSNNAGYYFHLGTFYLYDGLVDEMVEVLQKGLKLDPWPDIYSPNYFLGDPYFLMGLGLSAKEDYEGAEKNIMISLEKLDRNFAVGWAELAELLLDGGRVTEGKTRLDTALRLQPDLPRVKEVQAAFLLKEGKKQEARDILSEIIESNPRRIQPRLLMAEVLTQMGTDFKEAKDILERGVELLASDDDSERPRRVEMISVSKLYGALGAICEKLGNLEEAIDQHLTAAVKFKYNFSSLAALVELYKKTGQVEKAQRFTEKLKDLDPPEKYLLKTD
jgi:tetratricopeptide (TPR) repeat protein